MFSNKIREFYYKFRWRYLLSPSHSKRWEGCAGRKKCLVCLAADYGNLGDVAITYAQTAFLRQHLPDFEVVDFPISATLSELKALKRVCSEEDIITIVGGGNMGDRYFDIELLRLLIVKHFPKNRCIVFPQTIEYSEGKNSLYLQRLSQKIYSQHPDLLLLAREEVSYRTMQKLYPSVKIQLVPDIVMSLDKRGEILERKYLTFCLRNDDEVGNQRQAKALLELLKCECETVQERDTHIGNCKLSVPERIEELNRFWQQFRQSRWVVTDRLHGMIFAYITGTPALVFPNANFKIEKCFAWIKDCGYIYLANQMTVEEMKALISQAPITDNFEKTHKHILVLLEQIDLCV